MDTDANTTLVATIKYPIDALKWVWVGTHKQSENIKVTAPGSWRPFAQRPRVLE